MKASSMKHTLRWSRHGLMHGWRPLLVVASVPAAWLGLSFGLWAVAVAGPCDAPILNPIVCENSKPGNSNTEWDINGAGDPNIQGFATDISVNKGETVHFKVNTGATAYRL